MKIKTVRCLKDKISSGHFLIVVKPMDRLGGNKIALSPGLTHEKYLTLSGHLRDFAMKKRAFLNAENRSVAVEADGRKFDVSAAQTGMAFFKPGEENKEEPKMIDNS